MARNRKNYRTKRKHLRILGVVPDYTGPKLPLEQRPYFLLQEAERQAKERAAQRKKEEEENGPKAPKYTEEVIRQHWAREERSLKRRKEEEEEEKKAKEEEEKKASQARWEAYINQPVIPPRHPDVHKIVYGVNYLCSHPERVGASAPPGGVTVIKDLRKKLDEKRGEEYIFHLQAPSNGEESDDDVLEIQTEEEFSEPEPPPTLPPSSRIAAKFPRK